jgi:hypothetical protein
VWQREKIKKRTHDCDDTSYRSVCVAIDLLGIHAEDSSNERKRELVHGLVLIIDTSRYTYEYDSDDREQEYGLSLPGGLLRFLTG